ncbi:radical SAM protein [Geothrix sp. 21YS21S-2]|uniref:SPL family radical SAM protein n=1 Tax=Geothrix sp. 21YS21S-2 TaxID=3068893 RepID=UPI0027BA9D38|nr:radical SAM protein [Geothrix sp. 21YS21S-2]
MTPPLLALEHPRELFHDLQVEPEEARSILRPQKDDRYGFGFALSPYRGCEHGCRYCYVRDYPQALPGEKGKPVDRALWGTWAVPKLNAPELLWNQRHRLHGQTVFLASATDPYQPLEREFRLTRACLEVLLKCPTTRVLVHTRSPLVLQDLELLKAFGPRVRVGFSIPTDDDTVRQVVEPRSPPIPSRWAAMERLAKAGIEVNLAVAPLMPVHNPGAFARRAKDSGASGAWVGGLRLLKDDPFYDVLARNDWLFILDGDYVAQVAGVLQATFPRSRRREAKETRVVPPCRPLVAAHRSLFESM